MGKKYSIDQDNTALDKSEFNLGFPLEINKAIRGPRAGDRCPKCNAGYLDYDGLLNLKCQQCGYTLAGCST